MITINAPLTRRLLLPMVEVTRPSTACESVILDFCNALAFVEWKSGHMSGHRCRRRDMVRLVVNRQGSVGQWVNRTLLQNHRSVTV